MYDKLNEFNKNKNVDIPESFEKKFEETLKNLPDKKVHKVSKYKIIASIGITLFIASGIAMAISNDIYKYIPTDGVMMKSEKSIYIMEEPITRVANNGEEITFDISIYEDMERAIVSIGGKYSPIKLTKSTLKIGDKLYESSEMNTHEYNYTWGQVDVFKGIDKYNGNEEIIYTMYVNEKDKIEFKTKLKEVNGVSSYRDIGITSVYNNIPITVMKHEREDYVVANFMSELTEKGIYITAGIEGIDGTFSGIYLEDSERNRVYGMREISGGGMKINQSKFDTRKLNKPYKLVIPQIRMDLNWYEEKSAILTSKEVSIPIAKDGESIEINKDVKFNLDNKILKTSNDTVRILKGKRINNKYRVEIEYPKNERGKDNLISVMSIEKNIFEKEKRNFSQHDVDKDMNFIQILEFDISNFDKEIKFKLAPVSYELKGNWEFEIK